MNLKHKNTKVARYKKTRKRKGKMSECESEILVVVTLSTVRVTL